MKSKMFEDLGLQIAYVSLGLPLVILSYFIFLYAPLLAHPSFFIDESYYLLAARRLVSGDLFLREVSFDKPILQAVLPGLGILIAGENPVGFRLAAFLSWILALFVWFGLFQRIFSRVSRGSLWAGMWTFGLLLNSSFAMYATSPMAEAFLLLFLGLCGRAVFEAIDTECQSSLKRQFLWWAMAAITKQTMILWVPLFFLTRPVSEWGGRLKVLVRVTWPYFAVAILWMLTGPVKLAPVTMAIEGLGGAKAQHSLFESIEFWSVNFLKFGHGVLLLLACGAALGCFQKGNTWIRGASLATLAHFLFFIFARVNHFDRYFFIFGVELFFVAAISIVTLGERWLAVGSVGIFAIACMGQPSVLIEEAKWGRNLWALQDRIPATALIHMKNSWHLYSTLQPGQIKKSCVDEVCLQNERLGRPLMKDQWVFRVDNEYRSAHWERLPFFLNSDGEVPFEKGVRTITFANEKVQESFLNQIRLEGQVSVEKWSADLIELKLRQSFWGRDRLVLKGRWDLGFGPFDERGNRYIEPRFLVEELNLGDWDLTDWAFVIWRSSNIAVPALRVAEGPWERIESVELTSGQAKFFITKVKEQF